MTDKTIKNTTQIPATAIPLKGQHLIEASAGTGKTWTLTGIVLRLLIEAKRPPEQIICTTFTRAASAEMRERIMGRLQEFYQLLLWLDKLDAKPECQSWMYDTQASQQSENSDDALKDNLKTPPKNNEHDQLSCQSHAQFISEREDKLLTLAKASGYDTAEDPVNLYLIHYLLDNFQQYPLSMAIRRTQLLLISMDKLFVGTLDSLAQKWLGEYSAETGYQKGMSISDNETDMIDDIIHDELRKFQAQTFSNNPILYRLLEQTGKLTEVSDHRQSVNKAMQFISAPIDKPTGFDFEGYQQVVQTIIQQGIEDIRPYFSEEYRKKQGIRGGTILFKLLPIVDEVFESLQTHQESYFLHLSADAQKFLDTLNKVVVDSDGKGFGFNKNRETERALFVNLSTVQALFQLNTRLSQLDNEIIVLNYHIAQAVRHRLPIQLEEHNQTTFSLQMVRLNQALSGRQGQKLVRYIRHHYPVALIDESQDINGEQAKMIRAIYLNNTHKNQPKNTKNHTNFLLLVGDPKQAIYGFRGGDVANYNAMKIAMTNQFNTPMSLNVNRRSNASVIHSLNHWFGAGKQEHRLQSELGEDIYYQQIEAFNQQSKLSWQPHTAQSITQTHAPKTNATQTAEHSNDKQTAKHALSIIHLPYYKKGEEGADKYQVLAQHIQQLLNSNALLENRLITAQDIAVLARTKADLQKVQWALQKLGIATVKPADVSVFSSQMATDLLAVLQAVQHPYHISYVNRALTTSWYGLTLVEVKSLEYAESSDNKRGLNATATDNKQPIYSTDSTTYHDFQRHLQKAEQLWSDYGVLSAIQYLLADCLFYKTEDIRNQDKKIEKLNKKLKISIWEKLASHRHAERHLLDLRQLLELLGANTRSLGAGEVIDWLALQRQKRPTDDNSIQQQIPTESGVKLMTIHKSKGLEFPIVYVLGMDGNAKKEVRGYDLFPYLQPTASQFNQLNEAQVHRQLSPMATDGSIDYQAIVNIAELGEAKRVGYVALTRASEQIYVVLQDNAQNRDLTFRPANIWLECYDKAYQLPERLMPYVGWIEAETIMQSEVQQQDAQLANNEHSIRLTKHPIDYPDYRDVIKKTYFIGWSKTSFTALSRQLDKKQEDVAINEPDYVFEGGILANNDLVVDHKVDKNSLDVGISASQDDASSQLSFQFENDSLMYAEDNIRFSFVRGAGAGTFLHQVLEMMDFDKPHTWSEEIDKGIMQYNLPSSYATPLMLGNASITLENDNEENQHQHLKQWLTDVLHSPLQASGKKLIDIPPAKRKAELGFDMGLSDTFRVEQINEVLRQHLGDDSDKLLSLTAQSNQHHYRYLRGEIDLVYEDDGKYYVVDYKSNHLGTSLLDYHTDSLAHAMSKAGYWLQALIYQVALHRFLTLRIADYRDNEAKYLGAVEYMFLRGCVDDSVTENQTLGKITWDIPLDLVLDMDRVFGRLS